jgi:hypothetical protein
LEEKGMSIFDPESRTPRTTTLSDLDRAVVNALHQSGNRAAAYQAVADALPRSSEKTWFSEAAKINAGIGPGAAFADAKTNLGFVASWRESVDPRVMTNNIADRVLQSVLRDGRVGIEDIIDVEGHQAVNEDGLPRQFWTATDPVVNYMLTGDQRFADPNLSWAEYAAVWGTTILSSAWASSYYVGLYGVGFPGVGPAPVLFDPELDFINDARQDAKDVRLQIIKARLNDYTREDIDDALKSGDPGALSFLASGRDQRDNPYNPLNGAPQQGGTNAADMLRAVQNNPDYKPVVGPDPFKSPNPADRPGNKPSPSKSDGSYFSNLGGGGSSKPSPNKPSPSKSDGSYFSDLGGGGSSKPSPNKPSPSKSDGSYFSDLGGGGNKSSGGSGGGGGGNKPGSGGGANKSGGGGGSSNSKPGADPNGVSTKGDPTPGKPGRPILLDLDGDGIEITELSRSNVFVDAGGDGLLHRTAWAGAGDGVLFFDVNGDNRIGERREYVFTAWDPTATSDLAALRAAFDTNGDGKLTAADQGFAQFKVMVTNADGAQTARTLAELGITEISLIGDATHITLPDGTVISGQSTFLRADGTVGTVADAILMAEAEGRRVVQTATVDAAGNRTVTSEAYEADGSLAFTITSVTSANGLAITNSYDDNGDRVIDRIQTITSAVAATGARTETLVNYEGNTLASAAVVNRTVTTVSADRHTLTIERDSTGGGWFDQVEVRVRHADGSHTNTINDLARNGTVLSGSVETVTSNGSVRSETIDINGDGLIDSRTRDTFAQQGTERVNTVSVRNRDETLRSQSEERVSADGKTKRVSTDLDGNGVFETVNHLAISAVAGGGTLSTLAVRNANGTLRNATETAQSADTLTRTVKSDVDGDGDFDTTSVNVTSIAAGGSRSETLTTRNLDGSIREMVRTTLGADKLTRQDWVDLNQDGVFQSTDLVASVTVAAGTQARTLSAWDRNPNGSINRSDVSVTTADGLSVATTTDADGDGDTDRSVSDVTGRAANGVSTRTVTDRNGDGSQRGQTVTTSSADGLTVTTQIDSQGTDAFDLRMADQLVKASDGSLTRTVTLHSGDGAVLLSRTVTVDSADRLTSTVTTDLNGDAAVDLKIGTVETVAGAKTITTEAFKPNGQLAAKTVTTLDATGLIGGTMLDANGDGTSETVVSDVTTLNADGSRTRVLDTNNGNGTDRGRTTTWARDDGFETRVQADLTGDNVTDRTTLDLTLLGDDGSVTRTQSTFSGSDRLLRRETAVTSDEGQSVTATVDANGDGSTDWRSTSVRSLGNNGSITTEVAVFDVRDVPGGTANYGNALRARSVETVSDDGRQYTLNADVNGDGVFDRITARTQADTGIVTATVSERYADGSLQSRNETVTSANGLSVTHSIDSDGNGAIEAQIRDVSVLAANGSVTRNVSHHAQNGTRYWQESTVTSDDGTTVSQTLDIDGNGVSDRTKLLTSTLAATGVATTIAATFAASGQKISEDSLVTSADKRTVTRTVDENGDGVTDWSVATATGQDGMTTSTTSFFARSNGALQARTVVTTSQNGLIRTETRDWDGNGEIERWIRSETGLAADGSATSDVTIRDWRGRLQAQDHTWTSDDGLSIRRTVDRDGNGRADFIHSSVKVYEPAGDIVTTQETRNGSNNLLSSSVLRESGDGLMSQYSVNVNGSGGNERTVVRQTLADGESTITSRNFKTTGALAESMTVRTSADGRSIDRDYDDNGDGAKDRGLLSLTDLSRNTTHTYTDHGANGAVTARITLTEAANGMQETSQFDLNGNGIAEISRSSSWSFGTDGGMINTRQEIAGNRLTFSAVSQEAANGLSERVSVDVDGDGDVDHTTRTSETVHQDGSTMTVSHAVYSDGTRKSSETSYQSADDWNWWTEFDRNGDGALDFRVIGTRDAAGNITSTRTAYKSDGSVLSTTATWESADSLVTQVTRSGELYDRPQVETTTRSVLGDGSYKWNNGVTASSSDDRITSEFKVDAQGNVDWSYTRTYEYLHTNHRGNDYWVTDNDTSAVKLTRAAYESIVSEAERIYDSVLDRGLERIELERLVLHIENGALDSRDLALKLIPDDEFSTRFGTLSNADFVSRIYLNALGRAPSMDELHQALASLSSASSRTAKEQARATLAVEIANSSEHFLVGNDHLSTNNSELDLTSPQREALLDRAAVHASINRLFDTMYDRAPLQHELQYLTSRMMNQGQTLKEVASELLPLSGDVFGMQETGLTGLNHGGLVHQAFLNALGRPPTAVEAGIWTGYLTASRISSAEFLAALSESTEHRAAADGQREGTVVLETLTGTNAANTLTASKGDTVLLGLDGNDTLIGSSGAEELHGGRGNDTLRGGAGNDRYVWSAGDGNDVINDSSSSWLESNTLVLNVPSTSVSLRRSSGTSDDVLIVIGTETIKVTDQFTSANGAWHIVFSDGVEWRSDEIWAQTRIWGTERSNDISGRNDNGNIVGLGGNDDISGGAGDDWLNGGLGGDDLNGGSGYDVVSYMWSANGVRIDLATRFQTGNTGGEEVNDDIRNVEGVEGSSFADTLFGNSAFNLLRGLGGNDALSGRDGNDQLHGGAGDDLIDGGSGNDVLAGDGGNDRFTFTGQFGIDRISDFSAGAGLGDVIQLSLGAALDSFEEVLAAAREMGEDTVIKFGDQGTITLQSVALSSLVADDFMFA